MPPEITIEETTQKPFQTNPTIKNDNYLRWKFENLKDWTGDLKWSDELEVKDSKWEIGIQVIDNVLSLRIHFLPGSENESGYVFKFEGVTRILKQNGNSDFFEKDFTSNYGHAGLPQFVYPSFINWVTVKSGGYMKNDSIVIEADMDVVLYQFGQRTSNNDAVFKIDDVHLYFNKHILCDRSKFFYNKFFIDNDDSTYEIKGVENFQFCQFLATMCAIPIELTVGNCDCLMALAERFDVPSLHFKCEKFLIDLEVDVITKLEIAERYSYQKLMKSCAEAFNNLADIVKVSKYERFRKLEEATQIHILKRISRFDIPQAPPTFFGAANGSNGIDRNNGNMLIFPEMMKSNESQPRPLAMANKKKK